MTRTCSASPQWPLLSNAAQLSPSSVEQPVVSDPDLGGEEDVETALADLMDDESIRQAQHQEQLGGPLPLIDTSAPEVEDIVDTMDITTLSNTTSAHDDWLHRGPFLPDLDLHTYVAHVLRSPRPVKARVDDIQRVEHVFAFDDHYELGKSRWQ